MIYTLFHMFTHVYTCFAGKAKEFEDKLKHPLFPDNAFLNTIPEFIFALGFPADELHFSSRVVGQRLMQALTSNANLSS